MIDLQFETIKRWKSEMFKFTIRVGDIVTAYKSGLWKVKKIEKRTSTTFPTINPLVHLNKVCTFEGEKPKRAYSDESCDIGFCRPLEFYLGKERKRLKSISELIAKTQ